MTLVRPQVILSAAGRPGPVGKLGTSGIQLVGAGRMSWAKKHVFLKNPPYTIESPSVPQIDQRIAFGRAAQGAKGQRGLDSETGLPPAAAATMRGATGSKGGLPPEMYPSRIHGSFHSLAELETMRRGAQGTQPAYAPAYRGR